MIRGCHDKADLNVDTYLKQTQIKVSKCSKDSLNAQVMYVYAEKSLWQAQPGIYIEPLPLNLMKSRQKDR